MVTLSVTARRVGAGLVVLWAVVSAVSGSGQVASARSVPARPAAVSVKVAPSGPTAALGPLINIVQTWNNCGPASVAEVLAYWGIERTQSQVQDYLRADGNPGGMGPFGVPSYARSLGMQALLGVRGTPAVVKALVSNGFPVIVTQWVSVANHVGHYRPIEGYDDRLGVFISSDPYLGPGHQITYSDFSQIWSSRNQQFMVLYPPSRQALLSAVLASAGWNKTRAYQAALAAQIAHPDNGRQNGYASGPGARAGYRYYNKAWYQVQLGQYAAARRTLQEGQHAGANPVVLNWIRGEIPSS